MVVISESVSSHSLDFANQRKAYALRHVQGLAWEKIAEQVVNVSGEAPSWGCVRDTVNAFSVSRGSRKFQYDRCGRKPWKLTPDAQQFLIRRLLARRASQIVTSVGLQAELAAEKNILLLAQIVGLLLAMAHPLLRVLRCPRSVR